MKTAQIRIDEACKNAWPSIYTVRDMRDDILTLREAVERLVTAVEAHEKECTRESDESLEAALNNAKKALVQP